MDSVYSSGSLSPSLSTGMEKNRLVEDPKDIKKETNKALLMEFLNRWSLIRVGPTHR